MNKKTDLAWAKNWAKNEDLSTNCFTFKDLGVYAQGKFSEAHTLGFSIYSLESEKYLRTVYGATTEEALQKFLEENRR
jgi:hypothetical protein